MSTQRFDIEGELLTARQITDRAGAITSSTLRARLRQGDRTWARLLRPVEKKRRIFGRNGGSLTTRGH